MISVFYPKKQLLKCSNTNSVLFAKVSWPWPCKVGHVLCFNYKTPHVWKEMSLHMMSTENLVVKNRKTWRGSEHFFRFDPDRYYEFRRPQMWTQLGQCSEFKEATWWSRYSQSTRRWNEPNSETFPLGTNRCGSTGKSGNLQTNGRIGSTEPYA